MIMDISEKKYPDYPKRKKYFLNKQIHQEKQHCLVQTKKFNPSRCKSPQFVRQYDSLFCLYASTVKENKFMPKVIKWLLYLLVFVLLLAAIALFVLANNLGKIIKTGINDYGPELLGVPLTLGSASVSLLDGKASLGDLRIANPQGFSSNNAFELKHIDLALDIQSLQNPVIVIDRIAINGAAVNAEQIGSKINLQVLQNKMSQASSGSAPSSGSSSSDQDKSTLPKIAIAKFEFTDATASVKSDTLGEESVAIPSISLENIGTPENGLTPDSAAQAVMQPLMKKVIAEVKKQALDKVVDREIDKALDKALGDKAGQYKDKLKGLFK